MSQQVCSLSKHVATGTENSLSLQTWHGNYLSTVQSPSGAMLYCLHYLAFALHVCLFSSAPCCNIRERSSAACRQHTEHSSCNGNGL